MKPFLFLAGLVGFLVAAMSGAMASAENEVDSALNVSKAWIALIDAGQYDQSYVLACDDMHDKVKQDRWDTILKALRDPWGPVVSRKQVSHVYKGNGYEGTPGEFMVITYDSSFKKVDDATEVVVLKWEDGKWRGAGYNAGVKAPLDAEGNPPAEPVNPTEMHTEAHVKPQPQ